MLHKKLHHVLSVFRNSETLGTHVKSLTRERKRYVIEFSSPNIAKPFHFGHLRSTGIGNFISNLLSALDHEVIRINYLGDTGTQFGLLSLGYDRHGSEELLQRNPCKHLLEVYVRINQEADVNEDVRVEGKRRFHVLEAASDDRIVSQWNRFRELSAHHYQQTYDRLGISFHHTDYESMYSGKHVDSLMHMMRERGLLHEAGDGARMIRLSADHPDSGRNPKYRSKNQPKINEQDQGSEDPALIPLMKKDGSSLYLTRDIVAAIDRMQRFHFHHMLYVVDAGQSLHFARLKRILQLLGFAWHEQLDHVKFGRISGMSSRKGTSVLLEDILDEGRDRALKTIQETDRILVNDMRHKRTANYTFDWDQVLKQKGDTGIALHYAHARLSSLEKNSGFSIHEKESFEALEQRVEAGSIFQSEEGVDLVECLSQFDGAIRDSFESLDPMNMTSYLFSLSHKISKGLKVMPIKHESNRDSALTRLSLFSAAKTALGSGMQILGLQPLTAM